MVRLTGEDFNDIFTTFERSAFRLETLPHYAVPIEADAFAVFLAGQPYDLSWHRPWLDTMRGVIEAGRTVQRVRVMDDPPTPERRAVVMQFDAAGVFEYADVTEEASTIAELLDARDRAEVGRRDLPERGPSLLP